MHKERNLMMDVRLNTSNIPQQVPPLAPARDVGGAAQEPVPSVTVSKQAFPDFAGAEEVDAVTEADVATRDDALGRLFRQAFNYAPPPMPNFT
jgi:hypothetical protein